MTDVEDIIDYIKSLKKGFDKELFQSKVDELGYVVDTEGLDYESFHTLFKVWLNLSIREYFCNAFRLFQYVALEYPSYKAITKWTSLGICLVPRERVKERTVEYLLRWLMANFENQANFPRIGFVLDWLTAAMDNDCIDMSSLDSGYEIFYTMLSYEALTAYCMKLVYTLTKPCDVTRRRAVEILNFAKKREGKKNMYRQLQVLLGLFKSYKPECVPNDVPSISIHTSFRKLNPVLVERFRSCQSHLINTRTDPQRLFWINPINSLGGRNKKANPLVPNMEFMNVGSKQYAEDNKQKTYLDFSDAASLVRGAVNQPLCRPARLRALLCNSTGIALVALTTDTEQAFLSHDLQHVLSTCFLDISPHSYAEKQDLLCRLSVLQRTLMQGIPVITRFLAQYLPFWNEKDFFAEVHNKPILELMEWVNVDDIEHVSSILDYLRKIYLRSSALEQCAIMKVLTNLYANLVYGSTRSQQYFTSMKPSVVDYSRVLALVAAKISDMCDKGLQSNPEDLRIVYSSALAVERWSCAGGAQAPGLLALALPLLSPSAALLDKTAGLLLTYKQIFAKIKQRYGDDPQVKKQKQILRGYTFDFINCFYEQCLSGRKNGFIFRELHPQLVNKLCHLIPDADAKFSIRNHLALAPFTYMELQAIDHSQTNNKLFFDTVIDHEFINLSRFVRQAMSDLR